MPPFKHGLNRQFSFVSFRSASCRWQLPLRSGATIISQEKRKLGSQRIEINDVVNHHEKFVRMRQTALVKYTHYLIYKLPEASWLSWSTSNSVITADFRLLIHLTHCTSILRKHYHFHTTTITMYSTCGRIYSNIRIFICGTHLILLTIISTWVIAAVNITW